MAGRVEKLTSNSIHNLCAFILRDKWEEIMTRKLYSTKMQESSLRAYAMQLTCYLWRGCKVGRPNRLSLYFCDHPQG